MIWGGDIKNGWNFLKRYNQTIHMKYSIGLSKLERERERSALCGQQMTAIKCPRVFSWQNGEVNIVD